MMLTDDSWSPGNFMNALFNYYDTHSPSPRYFILSSGMNLFSVTQVWRELIQLEIEQKLTYPFYTSPLGFPMCTRAVMLREIFAATEGKVHADQFAFTPYMTIGAAQALAIVFAYVSTSSRTPSILLPGLNYPIFEQLARSHRFEIIEMIGEEKDVIATLPQAESVAQTIRARNPGVVVLVHPNNPSGEIYTEAELTTIFRAAGEVGSLLLIDQVGQLPVSYDAWSNVNNLLLSTQTQAQAVLVQSFSKSDSIPGFRVGYLAAPPVMAEFVMHYQQLAILNPPATLSLPIFLSSLY